MTNSEYWKKRAEERKNHVSRTADEAAEEARESFERARHRINREVAYWIQKFADAEGISYDEARKMLEAGELEQFRMTLGEYIARGKALDVDPEWQDAMVKASALHHIDRLNALKAIIRAELEENKARLKRSQWMHDIADYSYEHTLFGIETGLEIQINFRQPDLDTLHRDIEEAWAPDGIDFANRVGINNDKLAAEVDRLLTQGMITGETYEELAKQLTDQFALKEYEAARIIRTEATRVASMSEAAAYRTAGLEEYEILVTLDERTCSICGPMDGHVERVDDMEPGVTAPPFHPNCRCTTIGHYEDGLIDETRIARDENGKNIYVPADMTWAEWKSTYGNEAEGLAAKANVGGVKKHDPPVLLGKVDPHDRSAKMAALEEHERRIADSVIENAIVICKDGSVYQCFGVRDGVWPDEDLGERLIGAIVTHNHPEGSGHEYTFSNFDINLFMDYQLETLRGIDKKFVYQMSSVDKRTDPAIDIFKITEYDSRSETVRGRLEKMGIGYRRWSRE